MTRNKLMVMLFVSLAFNAIIVFWYVMMDEQPNVLALANDNTIGKSGDTITSAPVQTLAGPENHQDVSLAQSGKPQRETNNDSTTTNRSPLDAGLMHHYEEDVPVHRVEELAFSRQQQKATFFQQNTDQKVETINDITAYGEDLHFLMDIYQDDADPQVRSAVISRMAEFDHYASTHLLLQALQDPSPRVVESAIQSLTERNDRSVLPFLKDEVYQLADPDLAKSLARAIEQIEFSVTMQADGL